MVTLRGVKQGLMPTMTCELEFAEQAAAAAKKAAGKQGKATEKNAPAKKKDSSDG